MDFDSTITLVEGIDYTLSYSDNINVGTVTITISGRGIYEGSSKTAYFDIVKKLIDENAIESIADQYPTGQQIRPDVVVKVEGRTLVYGTDYDVGYGTNTELGIGTVTIYGWGNYYGEVTKEFIISTTPILQPTLSATSFKIWQTASGIVNLDLGYMPATPITLAVYDLKGKLIMSEQVSTRFAAVKVNASNGVYLFKVGNRNMVKALR